MNEITIRKINPSAIHEEDAWLNELNKAERHHLNYAPWSHYSGLPKVDFSILYSPEALYLRYLVIEPAIRAFNTGYNQPVWEDSCVEFFISFNQKEYYNFECNVLGSLLLGYGSGKTGRTHIPESVLSLATTISQLKRGSNNLFNWEISIELPSKLFIHEKDLVFGNIGCRGNFYKCGDLLAEPHFLTWTDIKTEQPDFHQPKFFGQLNFE